MLIASIGRAPNKQYADELRAIRAEVDELREYVASTPDFVMPPLQQQQPPPVVVQQPPPTPPPPPPAIELVSPRQLASLLSSLKRESFGDGKVRVLQTAVSAPQYFTVANVKEILNQFTYSKDKLTAVALLKPRIADPQNAFQ